jgi:hypothetical protein
MARMKAHFAEQGTLGEAMVTHNYLRQLPEISLDRVSVQNGGTSRATEQTTPARGGCAPALEFRLLWEGTAGTSQGRQPDSGNPTVRDENGGLGKRGHGSRTAVHGESRGDTTGPYSARARDLSRPRIQNQKLVDAAQPLIEALGSCCCGSLRWTLRNAAIWELVAHPERHHAARCR